MSARQDLVAGLLFAFLGLAAALLAQDYRGAAAAFPAALGWLMALLGLALAARSLWRRRAAVARPLLEHPRRFLITLGALLAYLATMPRIGFYSASLLLIVGLTLLLGLRRPGLLLGAAVAFVALAWLTFSLLLQRPLPQEFFLRY